jgi:UDP-2,3-diacylglucosamine pyrophosphatase LpxH
MSSLVYDTLTLSDLHLGSVVSCAEEALRMLRANRFRRLILLGDIFSDLKFWPADKTALEVSELHPQTFQS